MVVRAGARWLAVAGRLVNFAFFLLTSTYCLLASSPFANEQFLKPHISTWLTNFVAFHTDYYWLALSITALTLAPFLDRSPAKFIGWLYLAAAAGVGVWLATHRVMPDAEAPAHALGLAIAALLPPALLALFDHAVHPFPDVQPIRADGRLLASCALAAGFCWLTFAAPVPIRLANGGLTILTHEWLTGSGLAALAHAALFSAVFVLLGVLAAASSAVGLAVVVEYVLIGAALAAAGTWLIARLMLAPIAIVGGQAWLLAAVAATTLVLVWSGIGRLLWQPDARHGSVVDLWSAPLASASAVTSAALLLLLPVAAFLVIGRISMFDWDFMFQKGVAVAVAASSFAFIHALLRPRPALRSRRAEVGARTTVGGLAFVTVTTASLAVLLGATEARTSTGTYIAADPSLRLARDLLARRDQSSAGFYAYLRANTGIAAPVPPVDVNLVTSFSSAPAPHVFLFVIDSLRPDYLGVYNPAVTFTPAFDALARDSVVFERAFSRYGGTGLSVPAIWASGMILHKEYVTPFAPMNTLAKLLDAHQYRRFITADHITDALFPRASDTVDLDRAVPEMRHTLCGTLAELESKLTAAPVSSRPIFGHTRPLDLHIGNVWTARPDPGESYPGFHPAYASRVHRMDACFGRFTQFLRRENLYDDSVIIVTADHGDSLGEGLRWGHGFTVFPEVLRIPLIVHLPRRLAGDYVADVHRVSFTVDLTPTLYALMGEQPVMREPLQGSSLFARSASGLADRRGSSFLVASSYGPSYGVLSDNGERLYIADGINGREYAFELGASAAGRPLGLTDDQRAASRRLVVEQIDAIAREYGFTQAAARPSQ